MIKPLAPRILRGCSSAWLCLSIILAGIGVFPSILLAQDAETKKEQEEKPAAVAERKPQVKPASTVQILKDPAAEDLLKIETLKSVPTWKELRGDADIKSVKAMAAGEVPADRDTIQRFVQGMGFVLTNKANVKAWLDENEKARPALKIQEATGNLLEALNVAKAGKNTSFLKLYTDILITNLTKLLDNHLLPRTEAIIVLAQTENPDAVPIFLKQLKNPKQTVWVKLWSAQGLSNVAGAGKRVERFDRCPTSHRGRQGS